MSKLTKLSLVIGGYVLACVAAGGAVSVYQWFTQSAAAQASAGMSAFGDLLLFLFLFGMFALVPTGLGLYFLLRLTTKKS